MNHALSVGAEEGRADVLGIPSGCEACGGSGFVMASLTAIGLSVVELTSCSSGLLVWTIDNVKMIAEKTPAMRMNPALLNLSVPMICGVFDAPLSLSGN